MVCRDRVKRQVATASGVRKGFSFILPFLAVAFAVLAPGTASATSNMAGVSCTSATSCISAGLSDASGSAQANTRTWNGTAWSGLTTPAPTSAVTSRLADVYCSTSSACVAVGSSDPSVATETINALAMTWNGTSWSITTTPSPSESTSTSLSSVACTSTTSCTAVGNYLDSKGVKKTLVMSWNGTAWSIVSSPNVAESSADELLGVACWSSTGCLAVGDYANGTGTHSLGLLWNGTTWSTTSTVDPTGNTYASLKQVSCASSSMCQTVGIYVDSGGVQKTMSNIWKGSIWASTTPVNPTGATSSELNDVSCPTTSVCYAAGSYLSGNKELPLVEYWNSTSWSQKTVESESLGAVAVKFSSVSCVSTTSCHATGQITYGHSTTERNLAYKFDGTSWVLTESGGYQRVWATIDLESPSAAVQSDVSCASSVYCMRVGAFVQAGEPVKGESLLWNGTSWAGKTVPLPSGAKTSSLNSVACTSTTNCTAVGSYVDESGVKKTLTMAWNGTAWSVVSSPNITGSTVDELLGVACWASNGCLAVGDYTNGTGTHSLSLQWNGTSWSTKTTVDPSGNTYASLKQVACASSTLCQAVGSYLDSGGVKKTMANVWKGSTWAATTPVNPTGATASELNDVSCSTSTACYAVGNYLEGKKEPPLVELWNGTTWSQSALAGSSEAVTTKLSGVACVSSTSCITVGSYKDGGEATHTWGAKWNGTSWSGLATPNPSGEENQLAAATCTTSSTCFSVGTTAPSRGGLRKNLAYKFDTTFEPGTWSSKEQTEFFAEMKGVSCPTSDVCIAVGEFHANSDQIELGARLDENGWKAMTMAHPSQGQLNDVACFSAENCMAVGSQASGTLAERWNGTSWSVGSTPNPTGTYINLLGVSCATASSCVAVGSYMNGSMSVPLVESWNGTSWSTQTITEPSGSLGSILNGVSCTASTACTAVGRYKDSGSVWRAFAERWNGTVWSAQSVPQPSGSQTSLAEDVACTSSTACTLVGYYTASSGNPTALAERWNGTTWSAESVPGASGAYGNYLKDVTCFSSAKCVAVGASEPTVLETYRNTLVEGWEGGKWTIETSSGGEEGFGLGFNQLESISCAAAADCQTVGIGEPAESGGGSVLLAEKASDTTPAEGQQTYLETGDAAPALTAAQEESAEKAITADPSFQAAVAGASYSLEIGPWVERNAEGAASLVGTVANVELVKPKSWEEWKWPAVSYAKAAYEQGSYTAEVLPAAATNVELLEVALDASMDSEGNILGGNVVEVTPLALPGETAEVSVTSEPNATEEGEGY